MISMSLRSFKIQSYYILGILLLGWMLTPFRHIFRRWNWAYYKYCVWLLGEELRSLEIVL